MSSPVGFNYPLVMKEQKEHVRASCRRCDASWREEVTHYGLLANSKTYDYCSKCSNPDGSRRDTPYSQSAHNAEVQNAMLEANRLLKEQGILPAFDPERLKDG